MYFYTKYNLKLYAEGHQPKIYLILNLMVDSITWITITCLVSPKFEHLNKKNNYYFCRPSPSTDFQKIAKLLA